MKMIYVLNTARKLAAVGMIFGALFVSNAHAIKKCQDAEGNWHYGDAASKACDTAKVTELNSRGFVKGEQEALKTSEQLEAERESIERIEAEILAKEKEKAERERILSVYQSEADIDRQLDNQIYSVDSSIAVHQVYLKRMAEKVTKLTEKQAGLQGVWLQNNKDDIASSKAKIAEFESELKSLEGQKEEIKNRFAREKELYRSLKEEAEAASS